MPSPTHVYVSPHLDDALFSCGGMIHAQRRAGERVVVVTLCAGSAPGPLSPLALTYHAAWAESGDPMARRREENAAVLSAWGIADGAADFPDAIYRGEKGAPFYEEREDLFREPDPRDAAELLPAWEAEVRRSAPAGDGDLLHFPLGVGRHVDHELTRRLGERMALAGWPVRFYEDYPYAEIDPDGVRAARERFAPGPRSWSSRTVPVDVEGKIEAVRGYRSQIGRVFGCDRDLVRRVRAFTARTARAAEREGSAGAPFTRTVRTVRAAWRALAGPARHAERLWSLE